jgi:hypothetical protein
MEITEEILNKELSSWLMKNGTGRDKFDQRFGQHIWNKYDLDKLFPERDSGLDGFGDENPNNAYTKIMNQITKEK